MSVPRYLDPNADGGTLYALDNLDLFQIWYNGSVFGQGSNGSNWKEWDGFDIEGVRTGDSGRPRDQGEYAGYDFLAGRDITLKLDVSGGTYNGFLTNLYTLGNAFLPTQGNVETPFYFDLGGGPWAGGPGTDLLGCNVRARNRSWKVDIPFALGRLAQDLQVQVHATDPRFYSFPTLRQSFVQSPGLTIDNLGNIDIRPQITIMPLGGSAVAAPYISGDSYTLAWNGALEPIGYWVIDLYYNTTTEVTTVAADGSTVGAVAFTSSAEDTTYVHSMVGGSSVLTCNTTGGLADFPAGGSLIQVQTNEGIAVLSYTSLDSTQTWFKGVQFVSGCGTTNTAKFVDAGFIGWNLQARPTPAALLPGSQWFSIGPNGNTTLSCSASTFAFVDWASAWLL